jgi:signal transduction histidine kinase/CheY-like chemotaxis protein
MAVAAVLRWWPQDLPAQRHVMLQGYLLLIFITVAGFCFVQGPAAYLHANLLAMTAMALLYLLYRCRWLSLKATTHGLLAVSFSLIYDITLNAGGLASPQMLWLGMVPVPAIFLLGQAATLAWAGVVMLSVGLLFVLTFGGWLPVTFQYEQQHITWAAISALCIASNVFFLPLIYHVLNKRQLASIEHRNAELEQTRLALLQSENHKDKFMAAVGHELRTPMNAILGFNDVLRQEVPLQADDLDTVNLINQSTKKLLKLINEILDFSQLQAGRLQLNMGPTALTGLLQHCTEAMRHHENTHVPVVLEMGPDVPHWIQTDAQRLRDMLLHLLDNACKFTSEGRVLLRVSLQQQRLLFEVIDTGAGIAAELQTHIFKRFEHADQATLRQFGGTGLGLAISKQLVALFGGEMGLESRLGEGSRFWFRLPLRHCDPPSDAQTLINPQRPWTQPFSMLLVDDNPVNLQVARYLCQSIWPQAVLLTANSGPACLQLLKTTPVDLVLMDMFMPDMDGPQTCQTIRQTFPAPLRQLPIIGLTASTHPHDKQLCLDAGMNAVTHKPMDKADLTQVVQAQLLARLGATA